MRGLEAEPATAHRAHHVCSFAEARELWSAELEKRIVDSCRRSGLIGTMCDYHVASGGKRLRALLPVWVCDSLSAQPEDAFDLGAGLELLHNATLVHDDLQDGDVQRRGRPTVWRRWGAGQAINAGDALVFTAMRRIARAPAAPRILPIVCETMVRLIDGQAMDMQLKLPPSDPDRLEPTLDAWLRMAQGKTAALFALCFETGAIAGGADAELVAAAHTFGESLGLLFQVQDDWMDVAGSGRADASAEEAKLSVASFPVLWAYEHAGPTYASALRTIIDGTEATISAAAVEEGVRILDRCGAIDATAKWLRAMQRTVVSNPVAELVPGFMDALLAAMPVISGV
jgi:geranylgeranyl pyrophosphate synthase